MKLRPMPLSMAIFLLIAGIIMGSIFIFGVQHWNAEISREECSTVQTKFVSYEVLHQRRKPHKIHEYAVDCANNERYFIDGECINKDLENALNRLVEDAHITLLIHPNQNTIVEFTTPYSTILAFDDTMEKLGTERTGFLILGIFLYVCALLGLYFILYHVIRAQKRK